MSLLKDYFKRKYDERYQQVYSALIHHEAKVGGELFGPVPDGHRREFFVLDEHSWVWHEEWQDDKGQWQAVTTRYDVRPGGVLKSQGGQGWQRLSKAEMLNLYMAVELYDERIGKEQEQLLKTV